MFPLIHTKDTLFFEIQKLKKNIDSQADYFQMYSVNKGHDWRTWDKGNLSKRAEDI